MTSQISEQNNEVSQLASEIQTRIAALEGLFEESLVKRGFMRVHRSYIVNLSKVNVISKMRIIFDNDLFVPIGEMYKEQFINYLNNHFVGKN